MLFLFVNTGKSFGYGEIFLFAFLFPTFVAIVFNIIRGSTGRLTTAPEPERDNEEVETISFAFMNMEFSEPEHKTFNIKHTKEEQWNVIADATMEKAMQGDKAARDWVTKYIFTDPVTPDTTVSPLIGDAVDALKRAGYKASDVRKVANQLCSQNEYASLEDLIQDIIKNC